MSNTNHLRDLFLRRNEVKDLRPTFERLEDRPRFRLELLELCCAPPHGAA